MLELVKSVYVIPTWSRTVRFVGEYAALQDALGVAPSIDAAYRFTRKLREHSATLTHFLDRVLTGLREVIPDLGTNLAIDGSDLLAYANGMRDLPNGKPRIHYADLDASWGHRSAISTRKGGGVRHKAGRVEVVLPDRLRRPASLWVKADRCTPSSRAPPTGGRRSTGPGVRWREFGRLKHEWGLGPLRVRRLPRVWLHADLTILARLASALTQARAVPPGGLVPAHLEPPTAGGSAYPHHETEL